MSHDQNFKNLILDYPRESLAFFAAAEAADGFVGAEVTPLRQEQLKERLGERFRELDVPLLVTWSDERREAIVFVLEEETDARRFSIHRLAHYRQSYPPEANTMSPYFERLRAEGRQQGASALLVHLLQTKFGDLPEDVLRRVEQADPETLLEWSDRMITADRIDDVLH